MEPSCRHEGSSHDASEYLLDTDNKTISVQLNLTGTATGTELGNNSIKITYKQLGFDLIIIHIIIDKNVCIWPRASGCMIK